MGGLQAPKRPETAGQHIDVSRRALRIARIVDRLGRTPGTYIITLVIPTHRRGPWLVEFHRQERIRSLEL